MIKVRKSTYDNGTEYDAAVSLGPFRSVQKPSQPPGGHTALYAAIMALKSWVLFIRHDWRLLYGKLDIIRKFLAVYVFMNDFFKRLGKAGKAGKAGLSSNKKMNFPNCAL